MDLLEFQKADMNDQLWDIKSDVLRVEGRLEEGDRVLKEIREDLDDHVDDPNAHNSYHKPNNYYHNLSPRQKQGVGGGAVGTTITIIYVLHELGVI